MRTIVIGVVLSLRQPYLLERVVIMSGVFILIISYEEKPPVVKLPIFSEFMENSAKFMKNSGLTKWTQNLR